MSHLDLDCFCQIHYPNHSDDGVGVGDIGEVYGGQGVMCVGWKTQSVSPSHCFSLGQLMYMIGPH
jgi:hypothetical protein